MEQFKIGDWVKTKAGFIKQISCLTGDKCDTLSIGNTSVGINVVFKNEIELWQPKLGEWCWFYTSESKGRRYINPQLSRFQNFVKQNTCTYKNGYRFVTDVGFYKQCKPF